jgi:hypothetical protein
MSNGFGEDKKLKISVNKKEINNIIKKYKKIKKYMKTNLYNVKVMDNTEMYVSNLIKEATEDPPE